MWQWQFVLGVPLKFSMGTGVPCVLCVLGLTARVLAGYTIVALL
jgi:hypothetical protein